MNAILQATSVYGSRAAPTRSTRDIEYQLFTRVTRDLHTAAGKGRAGFPELASALHKNRTMWTALAADVAGSENQLPADLRAQLFYLAEFTEAHTRKVLRREAGVRPLLDVNMAVMRGLANTER